MTSIDIIKSIAQEFSIEETDILSEFDKLIYNNKMFRNNTDTTVDYLTHIGLALKKPAKRGVTTTERIYINTDIRNKLSKYNMNIIHSDFVELFIAMKEANFNYYTDDNIDYNTIIFPEKCLKCDGRISIESNIVDKTIDLIIQCDKRKDHKFTYEDYESSSQ